MAKRILAAASTNVSDASFRVWINEIHNALIAFGWLQTADTGQINFSTVTRPAGTNQYPGFACYQMNDALQSSCAVFIRLDFGTGGNTDTPGIKLQVAIGGTNGTGTLTGNVGTQTTMGGQGTSANLSNLRTSGDAGSFRALLWTTQAGAGFCICIERDKNTNGVDNALGVNYAVCWAANNAGGFGVASQFLQQAGGTGLYDTTRLYALISSFSSQTWGSSTGVAPVCTSFGPFRNPMIGMLVTGFVDFAVESTNPVPIYGSSRTYMMGRPSAGGNANVNGIQPICGLAILWE